MFAHTQKQNHKTALSASPVTALLPKAGACGPPPRLRKNVEKKGQKNVSHHFSYFHYEHHSDHMPLFLFAFVCIQFMSWQMVCIRQFVFKGSCCCCWMFWGPWPHVLENFFLVHLVKVQAILLQNSMLHKSASQCSTFYRFCWTEWDGKLSVSSHS